MENVIHVVQCNILKMLENNVWNVGLYFNDRNDMRWVFLRPWKSFYWTLIVKPFIMHKMLDNH